MGVNTDIVKDFIARWNTADLDRVMEAMTEDCFYHNIPWAPWTGQAEIRAGLAPFIAGAEAIDWIVHHIAESRDGTVLTERTDRFLINGQWVAIPVMGTFEIRDGKIAKWRDYFDPAQLSPPAAA